MTNVYLKAAQKIERGIYWHSCVAIDRETGSIHGWHRMIYEKSFSPRKPKNKNSWLTGQFNCDKDAREWSLTALCFAAAMRETGDL